MLRALLVVLLLGIALVLRAPAWIVADRVGLATDGALRLENASGTWRDGRADAIVPLTGSDAAIVLGPVRWHLDRIDWSGRAAVVSVTQDPPQPRALVVTASPTGFGIAGAARVPVAIVQRWPQSAGWTTGGNIVVATDSLDWNGQRWAGIATAQWPNAALTPPGAPQPIALGDVSLRLQFGPAGPAGTLSNAGGAMRLDGALDAKSARATLTVAPRPDAPPELVDWLRSRLGPVPPAGYTIAYALSR